MNRVLFALVGAVSFSLLATSASAEQPRNNKNKTEAAAKPSIGELFGAFKPGSAPETAIRALQREAREDCDAKNKKQVIRSDMKYGFTPCGDEAAASIIDSDYFVAPKGGKLVSLEDVTTGMENVTAVLRHVKGNKKTYFVYTGAVDPAKQNLASGGLIGVIHFQPDFNTVYGQYAAKLGAPATQADGSFHFNPGENIGKVIVRRFGESEAFTQLHARAPSLVVKAAEIDDAVANSMRRDPPATPPAAGAKKAPKK